MQPMSRAASSGIWCEMRCGVNLLTQGADKNDIQYSTEYILRTDASLAARKGLEHMVQR